MHSIKMRRNNKILLGLLALLLVMSTGYALFSDSVLVKGTAKAQGEFDIVTTCTPGVDSNLQFVFDEGSTEFLRDNSYENDSCSVSGDTVTLYADLLMPTATRNYTIKMKNEGTMDAVLHMAGNMDWHETIVCKVDRDTNQKISCNSMIQVNLNSYNGGYINWSVAVQEVNGNILSLDVENDLEALINSGKLTVDEATEDMLLTIKPGETIIYITGFEWTNGSEQFLASNEFYEFNHNVTFDFKQPTAK